MKCSKNIKGEGKTGMCLSCACKVRSANPLYNSQTRRDNISKGMMGVNTWMKGRKVTQATKEKMSVVRSGKSYREIYGKEKAIKVRKKQSISSGGDGSLKKREYPSIWNDELREKIRLIDGKRCFLCKQLGLLDVHHKDYVKMNCKEDNLITLCRSCHAIIHNNQRRFKKINLGYQAVRDFN